MSEMDEIHQEWARAARMAMVSGGQVIERIARLNEQREREAARAEGERARMLREQLRAEQDAARVVWRLAATDRRWWSEATEQQASRAWQYASAWSGQDVAARVGAEQIREFAATRWPDRDVDHLLRTSYDLTQEFAEVEADRRMAERDRDEAQERQEQAAEAAQEAERENAPTPSLDAAELDHDAQELYAEAARHDNAATDREHELVAATAYTRTTVEELEGVPAAAATARLDSAPNFGRPSREATAGKASSLPAARKPQHDLGAKRGHDFGI